MTYPSTTITLNGKNITIETGKFAPQASGSATVRCGDTIVLATVVVSKKINEGIDYFPLTLEYREKLYSAGIISSSRFVKREGRPSDDEILTSRVIDRSLRPLFDQSSRNDVQIMVTPLSFDGSVEPEILSVIAASAAVSLSDYPWAGPVGSVRIGLDQSGEFIVNPSIEEKSDSDLDLVVSGPKGSISMVESGSKEISEEKMIEALNFAQEQVDTIVDAIEKFAKENGKTKREIPKVESDSSLVDTVSKELTNLEEILKNEATKTGKQMSEYLTELSAKYPDLEPNKIAETADNLLRDLARDQILNKETRGDGRGLEDIRPINIEVGLLPRTHGSALFQRGLTHALSTVTLASPSRELLVENMRGESAKRYFHHYNMPGFASGEIGRPGTGRREIGHGALAERALVPVLPEEKDFPYTIRVVSDIMSSNGSTSQASVCGSTLSLMDAGVPIKKPVAGVAMGLITKGDKFVTLTDITGFEDHFGDMDFKVAGTTDGITALQMDVKVTGVNAKVLVQALSQAKRGRLKLLEIMSKTIDKSRDRLSPFAPKIMTTSVPQSRIGEIIGPGGKVIRQIQEDNAVEVDIDEDGNVSITGSDQDNVQRAIDFVNSLVAEAEIGRTYLGTVAKVESFGAFVTILPGKDGLVHVSRVKPEVLSKMKVGDKVEVRCFEIDSMGRINLTMLAEGEEPIRAPRPAGRGFDTGGDRGQRQGGGRPGGFRPSKPSFRKFRDTR